MRQLMTIAVGLLAAGGIVGCQSAKEAPNLETIEVDFSWKNTTACSSVSPAFTVANVPDGTKVLAFKMTDLDKIDYHHGGGSIAYTGDGIVQEGAFSYKGPCPPSGSHSYQWVVEALNESEDLILGRGEVTKPFPPR